MCSFSSPGSTRAGAALQRPAQSQPDREEGARDHHQGWCPQGRPQDEAHPALDGRSCLTRETDGGILSAQCFQLYSEALYIFLLFCVTIWRYLPTNVEEGNNFENKIMIVKN